MVDKDGRGQGIRARLGYDKRGSILPVMAVGLMVMIASVGSAIDVARLYIAQSQMQAGVDAAALAGANAFDNESISDSTGRRQQIIAYFKDNFQNSYMGIGTSASSAPIGGTETLLEPTFAIVNGISRTTVIASGSLPMTFMKIFGFDAKDVTATAIAEFQPHPLEVQVVLDNTGSMQETVNGVTKITALKAAMKSFINVLWQGGNGDQPMLALGIINYTNVVNVGSILSEYGVPIEPMPGFTDQLVPWSLGNGLAWKGCVANDDTITNMSTSLSTREPDAIDIWNTLPGESPPGSAKVMRPVRPHFSPPAWFSRNANASSSNPNSDFYKTTGDVNLFPSSGFSGSLDYQANTTAYKRYFYRYYIGLNDGGGPNAANDVITDADGGYYNPSSAGSFDWKTGIGRDFRVQTSRLPNLTSYRDAKPYSVTGNNAPIPSPNWQCPEQGLPLKYNVSRSTYDNFIDNKVWAILPASGTVHHSGLIWGWRILSRYTRFTRTPPAGAGTPVRALVFMTDGETVVPDDNRDRRFHFYGSTADQTITTGTTASTVIAASDLRFKKICAMANSTAFADSGDRPKIFVVAINKGSDIDSSAASMLRDCGTAGYWLTTSKDELANAFTQIGRTLIDVHLTK